ncbi:hypothetical protein NUW58_g3534 [Xylaria curta]|uniref:Uncharacterized protein n=1 Tax=Xylaria curta TaxID=42375 RepID=A0ACC1PBI6_9PEZI|nr:hypothetical protein NUW58_g3534 [Xylaria curta]
MYLYQRFGGIRSQSFPETRTVPTWPLLCGIALQKETAPETRDLRGSSLQAAFASLFDSGGIFMPLSVLGTALLPALRGGDLVSGESHDGVLECLDIRHPVDDVVRQAQVYLGRKAAMPLPELHPRFVVFFGIRMELRYQRHRQSVYKRSSSCFARRGAHCKTRPDSSGKTRPLAPNVERQPDLRGQTC